MEKTLTIDGKNVNFRCTGGTLRRYRNQFNSEFLADLAALRGAADGAGSVNFAVIENMIWVLAKTADPTLPDPLAWYDSFDEFNTTAVWSDLTALVEQACKSLVKNAGGAAAATMTAP